MINDSLNWTSITMTQVQLQQLQKQLWNIANTLRGKMGADEFRDYILGFILEEINFFVRCMAISKKLLLHL